MPDRHRCIPKAGYCKCNEPSGDPGELCRSCLGLVDPNTVPDHQPATTWRRINENREVIPDAKG